MRMLLRLTGIISVTIMLLAWSAARHPGQALIVYQWCASYGGSAGGTNCGFATYQQCRQSLAGGGGSCYENPMYNPPAAPDPASQPARRGKPRQQQ